MKKQLIIAALLVVGLGASAQTKEGFNVTASIAAVDFTEKLPLNTYLGDHSGRQNLNVGLEAGYFGKTLGLAVTAQTDFDLDSEALVGLKLYSNLFKVENVVVFKGAVYGRAFVNSVSGSNWQYGAEGSANFNLVGPLYSKLAVAANMTGDQNFSKVRPGCAIGLGLNF